MAPHRSASPSPSPRRLTSQASAPSIPHLPKRKRKGQPMKAPTGSASATTPSVNVSLLLRALLRESQSEGGFDNRRYVAPPAPSEEGPQSKPKEKKVRDVLPPAPAGFGRGKRSVSNQPGREASPPSSARSMANAEAGSSRGRTQDRLLAPPTGRTTQHKRAQSSEPSHHSAAPTHSPHSTSHSSMARASSVGAAASTPVVHHPIPYNLPVSPHLHHAQQPHAASPLARSFSFDGAEPEEGVKKEIKRGSSDEEGSVRESARVGVKPRGMRDYEMQLTSAF